MSEHSAEEVRARFEAWVPILSWFKATVGLVRSGDEYVDPCINSRWQGWQAAYAERIKADEGAAQTNAGPNAYTHQMSIQRNHPCGVSVDVYGFTAHDVETAVSRITKPPAQSNISISKAILALEDYGRRGNRLHGHNVDRFRALTDKIAPAQAAQVGFVNSGVQGERDAAVAALVDISEYALPQDDVSDREFTADGHKWCMQRAYKGMEDCDAARAAEPVAQGEAVAQRIHQRLAWLEHGQPIDMSEFCADVRKLAAQPRAVLDVRAMADRLMGWRLPDDFAPDAGISFAKPKNPAWWPTGTNLLTAAQAEQMFRYVLAAAPQPGEPACR